MTSVVSWTPERAPRVPLSETSLRRALLVPGSMWTAVRAVAQTGSTNADVAEAARAGAAEGLVVVAERQVAGRGRLGRIWQSPSGAGIAVSVLLRPGTSPAGRLGAPGVPGMPAVPISRYGWLPLLAGVALVQAVRRVAAVDAVLKWPNDLLIDDGKCGGILAEVLPSRSVAGDGEGDGGTPAVALGIGLNVTLRTGELPHPAATSLELAGAMNTDRDQLLRALLGDLAGWYARWRACGGDPDACGLRRAYLEHCATVGAEVRVALPGDQCWAGVAEAVDADGRLVVRAEDATIRSLAAGDVVHLRPASAARRNG